MHIKKKWFEFEIAWQGAETWTLFTLELFGIERGLFRIAGIWVFDIKIFKANIWLYVGR